MTERTHYPDLRTEYKHPGHGQLVAKAEWRPDEGKWVVEASDYKIRLWPDPKQDGGVAADGLLFNKQSKTRYDLAMCALLVEARKYID